MVVLGILQPAEFTDRRRQHYSLILKNEAPRAPFGPSLTLMLGTLRRGMGTVLGSALRPASRTTAIVAQPTAQHASQPRDEVGAGT